MTCPQRIVTFYLKSFATVTSFDLAIASLPSKVERSLVDSNDSPLKKNIIKSMMMTRWYLKKIRHFFLSLLTGWNAYIEPILNLQLSKNKINLI